jgi:4-amino-4-deoxy-L-arabinose transferase-like glycosyltransferase
MGVRRKSTPFDFQKNSFALNDRTAYPHPATIETDKHLPPAKALIAMCWALGLLTCALCLLFPSVDGDAVIYAVLAKNMLLRNDWVNLFYQGQDWLDKPHFPFWMMASAFKLFGVSERVSLLPGLLFYGLGGWYTHKLARYFFNQQVAALACLLYMALFGVLIGTYDQRAEVYLLGLMPGASYALLRFEDSGDLRWGAWGAFLGGCAMMTKGLIVAILLGAGVAALHFYRWSKPRPYSRWKWLLVLAFGLLFTSPELICLYLQFDAHPEKLVFERTGVSGLRFFFWDSQFGRFFNTGPITNQTGSPWFYLHNLVWTFFPWALTLVAALAASARRFTGDRGHDAAQQADVFLWAGFLAAFAIFSATSYQMDYYMFIVFPYGAIVCAAWLAARAQRYPRWWVLGHWGLCGLALLFVAGVSLQQLLRGDMLWSLVTAVLGSAVALASTVRRSPRLTQALAWGLGAVVALFTYSAQFHNRLNLDYNLGRQAALYMDGIEPHQTYVFNLHYFKTFEFLTRHPVLQVFKAPPLSKDLARALRIDQTFYVLAYTDEAPGMLQEVAGANHHGWRWQSTPPATKPAGPMLVVQVVHEFTDLRLPKQFVGQLLRDDAKLPRRTIQLLKITSQPG